MPDLYSRGARPPVQFREGKRHLNVVGGSSGEPTVMMWPVTNQPPYDDLCFAAQDALLIALRDGADLATVEEEVRRTACKGFTPDVAVLQLAAAAMDLAAVDRLRPLEKAELMSRHLADVEFRNQRSLQERTTYAINVVAAIRGGLDPDIVHDMYWWHTRDIVEYAVLAAVAYIRACADRRGQPLGEFVDELSGQLRRAARRDPEPIAGIAGS